MQESGNATSRSFGITRCSSCKPVLAELRGIRKYRDFVVNRDSTSSARLRARGLCGLGECMDASLKLRRGVTKEVECFSCSHF